MLASLPAQSAKRRQRTQRGSIALVVLAYMVMLLAVTTAGAAALVHMRLQGGTDARLAYLRNARMNVADWYRANAATIDAGSDSLSESVIRSAMGVPAQYGVQVASSVQLGLPCDASNSPSCVAYHNIYLWLPAESSVDTSAVDETTGTFTPSSAAQWVEVSGEAIERQLISSSTDTMTLLQTQLRSFFAASERSDVNQANDTNYFRDSDCSTTFDGSLPCVDTFADLTTTAIASDLGIDSTNASNAWGYAIQVTNQEYSSVDQAPYSMAIRSATPWGSYLQMAVVQPN